MYFYKSLAILFLCSTVIFGQQKPEPRPYFTEPSLSPDRKEIAFVSGGDIWTVPASGGVAALLHRRHYGEIPESTPA